MKEEKTRIFIGGTLIILAVLGLLTLTLTLPEQKITEGKCYDERNNEIIGLTCQVKEQHTEYTLIGLGFLILGFLGGILLISTTMTKLYVT